MYSLSTLSAALFVLSNSLAAAYNDNCDGSSAVEFNPINIACDRAKAGVDSQAFFEDGAEFSVGNCYAVYATNGAGPNRIQGQNIIDTMNTIIQSCDPLHGSYGTGNCDSCHVTLNYRVP